MEIRFADPADLTEARSYAIFCWSEAPPTLRPKLTAERSSLNCLPPRLSCLQSFPGSLQIINCDFDLVIRNSIENTSKPSAVRVCLPLNTVTRVITIFFESASPASVTGVPDNIELCNGDQHSIRKLSSRARRALKTKLRLGMQL